ncbi:hypothetical protein KJE20_14254 [Pyrenophora tritici-repentis]|nr:hypothetical protein KJE20_14254 [Pyrenophora tritici-repentis]
MDSEQSLRNDGPDGQNQQTQPSYEDLLANNEQLRQGLNHATAELQRAQNMFYEFEQMKNLLRTIQGQLPASNAQTPTTTLSGSGQQPGSDPTLTAGLVVRRFEKARLPDVEVFDKGTHEEYSQWKTRVRAKLFADHLAYPTEDYQVHYVITRTKGWAFTALQAYVTAVMDKQKEPSLNELWAQLDGFFQDPTIKQKALQYLRTTKQGKGEFLPHVQAFNLKFYEAGLSPLDDALKIDYLKNSLNRKLLRYQAGYQPPASETYENFVNRMRVTWENLKAVDQLPYDVPAHPKPSSSTNDVMDWTPTVGAIRPRTKNEYWGTRTQIAQRKEEGSCLRCGLQGHRVRHCKATVPERIRNSIPTTKAMAATVEDDSSDEGKEEP